MIGELKPYCDLLLFSGAVIAGGFGFYACEKIREKAAGIRTKKSPINLSFEEACELDAIASRGVGYTDADGD